MNTAGTIERSHEYEESRRIELEKTKLDLNNRFTYHAPKPGMYERSLALREKAKELAYLIVESTPKSREQSVALTELETAVFWANAAIARNE